MYFMKDGNNVSLKITKNLISFCLNRPTFLYVCPYTPGFLCEANSYLNM